MTHRLAPPPRRLASLLLALALAGAGSPGMAQTSADPATWPDATLPRELPLPDLGFLNDGPAGSHGRVLAAGEDLVFEDGTPARFWGTNLQAYALFLTEPDNIRAHARRIASLGFNLVRIHHHDSVWVQPNVFGTAAPTTRQLDPQALARLDLWIAALKAEGVYVWLGLHDERRVTPGDGIAAFDEIARGEETAFIFGYCYVSPSIQDRMLEFQAAYLGHVNALTGLSYADDPAIVAVQITNENDLTDHFGNALLPDKGVPTLSAAFMSEAEAFAKAHRLDPDRVAQTWEHGPSKLFLNDLEHRFHQRMIEGVRAAGFPGLVSTTSTWGDMPFSGLPSLTTGTLIDAHSYGAQGEVGFDPRTRPGLLDWVAAAQVAGMPLSISEWNVIDFPVEDRFIAPLRMATAAAHQGWDAPIVYGYAQQPLNDTLPPGNWDFADDPGMIAMMPAAALLYRQGHVRPAARTYALRLDADTFFGRPVTPVTSAAIRTLTEQSRLVVELPASPALPWLKPMAAGPGAIPVTDPDASFLPPGATEIASDTGEFRRDFVRGLFTVDTPQSQIAAGRFAGVPVALSDIRMTLANPVAAVAVQSLDGAPLGQSRRIMVSLSARAVPSGPDDVSYRVEPLDGTLRIAAPPDLELRQPGRDAPLDAAHRVEGAEHVIDLSLTGGALWLVLE